MHISITDLSFSYFEEGKEIFTKLDAAFEKKDITILTGPSGCGKSTLLYLMAGLYPHHAGFLKNGSIRVDEQDPAALSPSKRCRLIGMMFQNPDLQFCMDTVENEMIFCLENMQEDPARFEEKIIAALSFSEIVSLRKRRLDTLSGGEKQKVALALLTLYRPKWLLLDEPFANVDRKSAMQIREKLQLLHREYGIGIVAVDHRPSDWEEIATRFCYMENGSFLSEEKVSERLARVEKIRNCLSPKNSHPAAGEKILELSSVSISHGDNVMFQNLNLILEKGKIYALLGESGCGKSTLLETLLGLHSYKGTIHFLEEDLRKGRKRAGSMGFVTQSPQDQFIGGTVKQEMEAALKGSERREEIVEKTLRGIKLWRYRDISPYMLSQGQQRRLGVATLLSYPCKLLLCDEPTYAQDWENAIFIMKELTKSIGDNQTTLLFTTHDVEIAKAFADHLLICEGGVIHEYH